MIVFAVQLTTYFIAASLEAVFYNSRKLCYALTMNKYQEEIDAWFKKQGWQYWEPLAITARLFEEGGEFARLVNHIYGPKKKKPEEYKQDLEEEIGDIIYTLICFANK